MDSSDLNKCDTTVQLVIFTKKERDLKKCIICQVDDKKLSLTSTENGREKIAETSKVLKDNISDHKDTFVYHIKCYRPYILKGSRRKLSGGDEESINNQEKVEVPKKRQKRHSSASSTVTSKSICVICNKMKFKGVTDTFRICEYERAQLFIDATKCYLDEVHTRTSTLYTAEDVFASDIYCHKLCINNYLLKYKRRKSADENPKNIERKSKIQTSFDKVVSELNFLENGYALSDIRDKTNVLSDSECVIENRKVKELLIEKYGENICFTYPKDRTKSQMVYSKLIPAENIVETIRSKNIYKECASALKEECLNFDFGLDNTFWDADDLD